MGVFTVFNHGTGGASSKSVLKAEIVNIFGNEAYGARGNPADCYITEGVGKEGNPTTLQFDPSTGTNRTIAGSSQWGLTQQARGTGVDQNVQNALAAIRYYRDNGGNPTAVNMMGWSRGAVTCFRIAYFMYLDNDLRHIPVNIFAVDPVAGGGHNNESDANTIFDNVRNLVSCISLGENRRAFKPMTEQGNLAISANTNYLPLTFPGVHDTIAKYNNAAGQITFNLAQRFLSRFHSRLGATNMFTLGEEAAFRAYSKLSIGRGGTLGEHADGKLGVFEKAVAAGQAFGKGLITGGGRTSRNLDGGRYVRDAFFINAHHEALFKSIYPMVYVAYFGTMAAIRNTTIWDTKVTGPIANEMAKMAGSLGSSWKAVKAQLDALKQPGGRPPVNGPALVAHCSSMGLLK